MTRLVSARGLSPLGYSFPVPGLLTVNVLGLVPADLADLQFTVGCLGGAVAAGQVVDDQAEDVCARDIGESGFDLGNVRNGVASRGVSGCSRDLLLPPSLRADDLHPQEAAYVGNLGGRGGEAGVGHLRHGGGDLVTVELVGVERVLLERVAAGVQGDGRRAPGRGRAALVLGGGRRGSDGRSREGQDCGLRELHAGRKTT